MNNFGQINLNVEAEYDVSTLLSYLEQNKKKHIDDYTNAMEVFKETREKYLAKIAAIAGNLAQEYDSEKSKKLSNYYTKYHALREPVNVEKMYDQYKSLLGAATSKTIKLNMTQANAFINDEWDWSVAAKLTNSSYFS